MSRKRKTDAADAQMEDLASENEPREGAGDGQAAGEAGPAGDEGTADALDGKAPADGADDAGDEGRGDDGAETAGADDEGPAPEEEDDDAGLADELDEHVHVPADYEIDAPVKVGDRVQLAAGEGVGQGTVEEVSPHSAIVRWDDSAGEQSIEPLSALALVKDEVTASEKVTFIEGDRVALIGEPQTHGTVDDFDPETGTVAVVWDVSGCVSDLPSDALEPISDALHVDVLAACAAAAIVFGTHEHDATSLPVADYSYLSAPPIRAVAQCAADFVRANRDTNAGVIPIHLGLKGHRPKEEPIGHREHASWTIFKATLDALDNMRQLEALDAENERRAAEAKNRRPSAPRDRLALQPQEDALRPTGFTPSR